MRNSYDIQPYSIGKHTVEVNYQSTEYQCFPRFYCVDGIYYAYVVIRPESHMMSGYRRNVQARALRIMRHSKPMETAAVGEKTVSQRGGRPVSGDRPKAHG